MKIELKFKSKIEGENYVQSVMSSVHLEHRVSGQRDRKRVVVERFKFMFKTRKIAEFSSYLEV